MAGYGVKPWQDRLTRAIGMAGFVNLHPSVLEQVLSFGAASVLALEKS
jgi:hypothetical protein